MPDQFVEIAATSRNTASFMSPLRWGMCASLAVTVMVCWVAFLASRQAEISLKATLDEDLKATVQVLAQQIDPIAHASLVHPEDEQSETYRTIFRKLRSAMGEEMPFAYAYTMRPGPDGIRFVVDAAEPGDADGDGVDDHAYLGEVYDQVDPAIYTALRTGQVTISPQPFSDKWGTFISGFAPIFSPDGKIEGIVGLDYRADDYLERIRRTRRTGVATAALGALLSIGLGSLVFLMSKRQLRAVSEVQRVLAALADSEERLRLFISHAPAAVAMFDLEMRYLAYSRRWIDDYDLEHLGDIRGLSHYDVFPEITEQWKEMHRQCLAGAVKVHKQDPFVRASGRTQWLQWEIRPWRQSSGAIGGLLMFTIDVTESVEQQRVIAEQAHRLDLTVHSANLTTWDYDVARDCFELGGKQLTPLGYDNDIRVLSTEQWLSAVHPEDRTRVGNTMRDTLMGLLPEFRSEYRMQRLDGNWIWVFGVGQVTARDQAGHPLRAMGIAMDISDNKGAEMALRSATADARRLASAIDAHTDAVLLTDSQGRITQINHAFETLTGLTKHEALGKTLDVLESDPSSAGALQQMWETISSGRPWAGRMRNRRQKRPANSPTDLIPTDKAEEYWADVSITPLTNDDGSIDGYVAVQRDVSAEVEREEQLARAAQTDRLTGLGNRLSVQSYLQRALEVRRRRPDYQFALMFLDLDRFKIINDSLGHHIGDLLLQEVAKRLGETLRSSDYVLRPSDMRGAARWGGDEFVVLMDEYQRTEDVALVAERIQRVLAEPYHLAGRTVLISASIGVVVSSGQYNTADEMLRDADTAMYEAKSRGKACWVMFDVSMQKAVQRRLQIETELRTALHERQFYLLYQPIVSVQDGSLQGVEALVRWEHPTRGLISPSEFIPIAEESRAISDLGRWILEEACRQWTTWQRTQPERTPPYIAINVSRVQIADHEFVDQVRHILHSTAMEPRRLVIEVTESTVMRDHAQAQTTLNELRSLGIRLAIDDFGAGYSSLSCLHQFPFDILKIDRSFLSNFQQSEQLIVLTQAIVDLAKTLGLECIAEGIENAEQQQALLQIGCPCGQGFFYAKPHAPKSIIEGAWRAVHSPSSSSGATLPAITMDTPGTWLSADQT